MQRQPPLIADTAKKKQKERRCWLRLRLQAVPVLRKGEEAAEAWTQMTAVQSCPEPATVGVAALQQNEEDRRCLVPFARAPAALGPVAAAKCLGRQRRHWQQRPQPGLELELAWVGMVASWAAQEQQSACLDSAAQLHMGRLRAEQKSLRIPASVAVEAAGRAMDSVAAAVAAAAVVVVAVSAEEVIACEQPALPQTDAHQRNARARVRVGSQAEAMLRLPAPSPSIPHAQEAAAAEAAVEADAIAAPAATGSCSAPVREEMRQLMVAREMRELRRWLRCD